MWISYAFDTYEVKFSSYKICPTKNRVHIPWNFEIFHNRFRPGLSEDIAWLKQDFELPL